MPRNVNPTSDNGYIFSGITDFPNTAQLRDNAFVAKTDSVCYAPKLVSAANNISFLPQTFQLNQNYPNPFNPITQINFQLPKSTKITMKVFDISGKEIKTLINEFKQAGSYSVSFDGNGLSSGVYFYRIEAGDFVETKRMVLLK